MVYYCIPLNTKLRTKNKMYIKSEIKSCSCGKILAYFILHNLKSKYGPFALHEKYKNALVRAYMEAHSSFFPLCMNLQISTKGIISNLFRNIYFCAKQN